MRIDTVEQRLLKKELEHESLINKQKVLRCNTCSSEDIYRDNGELICFACGAIETIEMIMENTDE